MTDSRAPSGPPTKAEQAALALSKSVLPVRNPVVDGLTCDADVPFPIHHELMEAAIAKQISLPWLCAIYRAGVQANGAQDILNELQQLMAYTRQLHARLSLPDGDVDVLKAAGILDAS